MPRSGAPSTRHIRRIKPRALPVCAGFLGWPHTTGRRLSGSRGMVRPTRTQTVPVQRRERTSMRTMTPERIAAMTRAYNQAVQAATNH